VSISRSWSTKRSLASVEIPSSKATLVVQLAIQGSNNPSEPCLDRPEPRHRTILRIRLTPGCHGNPTIEKRGSRI